MGFQAAKEMTPQEVEERLGSGEGLYMLDVREPAEWAAGHLAGAVHIPLGQLIERVNELDAKREIIVMCRGGGRSGLACELLGERGFSVVNMAGGLLNWTGELTGE
ncbi:rhodanese-like domain-containing protein [Paenibacillus lignilyticus]|uniref:Rhodanese-like domain-containing protein n=1 Tax=Paenibacillus lignilyticus TaxID=1172615 RepID=A0ABS5CGI8_9BACL|nr:rhodanese-like domain-containing protein [Paenibacillus lignilyticus]MBP3964993.1 rhodanese-like domain-containing protein [Paenibacillus lignilyticus]